MKKNIVNAVAYALAAVIIALALTDVRPESVGIAKGAGILKRVSFHFFHANIFHALANAWCIISQARCYDISVADIATAFVIAALCPSFALSELPTLGLSALCFAILGIYATKVRNKVYYNKWMLVFIAAGFVLPAVNAWIHLYAYCAGFAVAYIINYLKKMRSND